MTRCSGAGYHVQGYVLHQVWWDMMADQLSRSGKQQLQLRCPWQVLWGTHKGPGQTAAVASTSGVLGLTSTPVRWGGGDRSSQGHTGIELDRLAPAEHNGVG